MTPHRSCWHPLQPGTHSSWSCVSQHGHPCMFHSPGSVLFFLPFTAVFWSIWGCVPLWLQDEEEYRVVPWKLWSVPHLPAARNLDACGEDNAGGGRWIHGARGNMHAQRHGMTTRMAVQTFAHSPFAMRLAIIFKVAQCNGLYTRMSRRSFLPIECLWCTASAQQTLLVKPPFT